FLLRVGAQLQEAVFIQQLALLHFLLARIDDDVIRIVDHALEIAQRHVEQIPHRRRQRLEEPDVRDRHRELDVAHALAPDLGQRHFDAATVADHAAIADALVLAAMALPVLDGTEDALAEQAVLFGLERPVVDRLGLGDLAPRPPRAQPLELDALALLRVLGPADLLGRGDPDLDEVERRRAILAYATEINHGLFLASRGDTGGTRAVAREFIATLAHRDLQSERLQLLHEHVEGLGDTRIRQVLPLHDRLVDAASAVHVVRLDREDLLQDVRGAVCLQRPHFHLSETLAAELRLAGERLLRDEGVRSDAARVDLVVHEVRQLEHVDLARGDRRRELLAAAAVAQPHLAPGGEAREAHELLRRRV